MAAQWILDDELREMTNSHECIVVKYFDPSCLPCNELLPAYMRMSDEPRYKRIVFVIINALENPTAKLFVADQKLPLLAIYKDGHVLSAGTVSTEKELRAVLEELLAAEIGNH